MEGSSLGVAVTFIIILGFIMLIISSARPVSVSVCASSTIKTISLSALVFKI